MAGWKELLIDVLKLTDETKRLNQDIDKLQSHVVDVDKRVVRLETLVEVSKYQAMQTQITD
ncbi:MAG: 3D (Asp-Asp-Asp) domain-containing protein [Desulforhopalus sp.]|jgi:3D (Asp-Asp-Asp) domain-containing protein